MDQIHIGKFIAERRESKKINQIELAEKLGVTNKAISKWENGRGMPDYSLFKPLCKELDISVSELLNGELDTKNKQNKEDAITNYISYKEKIHKRKSIILVISILVILLTSILAIYFINSYKKISIYELSGESENFKYENGLLVKSNIKTILELGNLTSYTIEENQILGQTLSVKIDNEYYFISNIKDGEVINENYGYGEYLDDIKLQHIPNNLYIIIWYKSENEIITEILKVKNEKLLINDKIIYQKQDSIDNNKAGEPININKYDNVKKCENYYINIGLKKENNIFTKELNKNETIKFSCYSIKGEFVYELNENDIKIKTYGYRNIPKDKINTISFDINDKKNNIRTSIIYDLYKDKIIESKYSKKYEEYIIKAVTLSKKYKYKLEAPQLDT